MFQNPWSGVLDSNNEQDSQGYWIIYHDILAWQRCEVVNGNFNDPGFGRKLADTYLFYFCSRCFQVFVYLACLSLEGFRTQLLSPLNISAAIL